MSLVPSPILKNLPNLLRTRPQGRSLRFPQAQAVTVEDILTSPLLVLATSLGSPVVFLEPGDHVSYTSLSLPP